MEYCLRPVLYKSVVLRTHNGFLWLFVGLWFRIRRALFVSWLVAFSAQFVDSLLAANVSDLTYTEMMWSNLQHRSSTPMMFLGFCSAAFCLTEVVWKLVYLLVARSVPRYSGMSEVLTLFHLHLVCFFLKISPADMFNFSIAFLISLGISHSLKELLQFSDDRPVHAAGAVEDVPRLRATIVRIGIAIMIRVVYGSICSDPEIK